MSKCVCVCVRALAVSVSVCAAVNYRRDIDDFAGLTFLPLRRLASEELQTKLSPNATDKRKVGTVFFKPRFLSCGKLHTRFSGVK